VSDEPRPEIPDRKAFKASEVCAIAHVQPYVLRSWESEFPELGLSKTPGGPRVYRRADVERVLLIKQMVFVEGLTLSGARRRLDGDPSPVASAEVETGADDIFMDDDVRRRLRAVRDGLMELKTLLSRAPTTAERSFALEAPAAADGGAVVKRRVAPRLRREDPSE
jgi:DNA-binding transcriptional MerR regulator